MKMYVIFICLLIGNDLTLIWSQAPNPSDSTQPNTCNACCQGPAGVPGVPGAAGAAGAAGTPGNNGLSGRDGLRGEAGRKGEVGERGERGESGLPGPQGTSGDLGERGLQGPAGKLGPRGMTGMDGLEGRNGSDGGPGPRGLKGQKGDAGGQRRSAFSVGKTSSQTGNSGDILTFEHIEINIGNHYSTSSHKFTCQIPGTYVFMFTITSSSSSHDPVVHLKKDSVTKTIAVVRKTDSGGSMYLQSSQGVLLQLEEGNQVWLQFGGSNTVKSEHAKSTTFAGYLLYED